MTAHRSSILVISRDAAVSEAIGSALADSTSLKVDRANSTLSGLNGKALSIVEGYDMIIFQTDPDDAGELMAVETLARGCRDGVRLVALADSDISLQKARALSRAGVNEVLPIPFATSDIGDQIARIGRPSAPATNQATAGRIIAVAQSRGGVGSTTVAVNLADRLAGQSGRRQARPSVALVDLDLQFGTVGSYLDLEDQDALLNLAMNGIVPDATFLQQSMAHMASGLKVLAAPSKFAPLDSLRPDQVAAILDTLRATNDYVIVDLPRALVGWIEPVVQRADELIVVTDISVSSVRHCRRLIDFFTADHLSLPVQVVVNHERKPLMRSRLHREAEKALQRKFDHWLPHDPRAAAAAADRGKPLASAAPRSALTKAVSRLALATRTAFPAGQSTLGK